MSKPVEPWYTRPVLGWVVQWWRVWWDTLRYGARSGAWWLAALVPAFVLVAVFTVTVKTVIPAAVYAFL